MASANKDKKKSPCQRIDTHPKKSRQRPTARIEWDDTSRAAGLHEILWSSAHSTANAHGWAIAEILAERTRCT